MLLRGSAPRRAALRAGIVAAVLACSGAWVGCNEIFGIGDPVLEMPDGGHEAGSSGGSGGGGHDAGPVEDCLNGIDDDGDGFVDCEDPKCQVDYGCAVDPEAGWTGLVYVQEITYNPNGAPPSPCPDGKLPGIYYAGPSQAECSSCSCMLSGATCTAPKIEVNHLTNCSTVEGSMQATNTACVVWNVSDVGAGMDITAPPNVVSKGTCTANGGALINPDPWGQEVRVCAVQAGKGCSAGKSCVKKAPAGFQDQVCISQAGAAACPAGWTDQSLQVYSGGTDGRACSTCTCDNSTVTCTGGKYTVNATADCSIAPGTTPIVVDQASGCDNVAPLSHMNNYMVSLKPELGTPGGETCGTAKPSGSVATMGDTRVCCRQMTP